MGEDGISSVSCVDTDIFSNRGPSTLVDLFRNEQRSDF